MIIDYKTRMRRRLRKPNTPGMTYEQAQAHEWFSGFWHGIALGAVLAVSVAVVVLRG